jgi:hypothetical protein
VYTTIPGLIIIFYISYFCSYVYIFLYIIDHIYNIFLKLYAKIHHLHNFQVYPHCLISYLDLSLIFLLVWMFCNFVLRSGHGKYTLYAFFSFSSSLMLVLRVEVRATQMPSTCTTTDHQPSSGSLKNVEISLAEICHFWMSLILSRFVLLLVQG